MVLYYNELGDFMNINLMELHSGIKTEILVDDTVVIDKEYYENSDIKNLKDISVKGRIYKDYDNIINYEFFVEGAMILEDSISLEEVDYPFSIEIEGILEENSKKLQNTLDLIEILWENIVLEVPLKFSKVEDLSQYKGEGWKIISEEDLKLKNNPFADL